MTAATVGQFVDVGMHRAATPQPVATHRHTSHEHEHEFEAAPGLPEALPPGETVLWQGAPDWKLLARECFHARKLAIYFAALVAWRAVTVIGSGADVLQSALSIGMAIGLAVVALGLVTLMAWMSARTALYTITNRRVVMRVGIVLSVTFNLPFRKIDAAGLHPLQQGFGDVALTLDRATRIAYPHLWPHVRPWQVARPQPAMRCIADAARVATQLTDAWRAERAVAVDAPVIVSTNDSLPPQSAVVRDTALDLPQAA